MRKRKKRSNALLNFMIVLFFLVLLAGGYFLMKYMPTSKYMDLYTYYETSPDAEGAVIILGEDVLKDRGFIEGEMAYLPLDFVTANLNAVFYYNQDTSEVFYCTPSEILKYPASYEMGEPVVIKDEVVYLSLDLIKLHTDLDTFVYHDPDRIILRNRFAGLNVAMTLKDVKIRYLGGIKSEVLTEVSKGENLIVLADEDDWIRVSTWNGYAGYVETRKLSSVYELTMERSFVEESHSFLNTDTPVNLVWAMVTNLDANRVVIDSMSQMRGVNVVSPTWFSITDTGGNLSDLSSADFVDQMHDRGISVWALIDNFQDGVSTFETMSHSASRERVIDLLMEAAKRVDLDGINLDFEYLTTDSMPHVLEFMRELSIRTHQEGIVLSFDNPNPDVYTSFYNYREQAKAIDYSIIMGYDEHYRGSEAGSVASFPWVESGVVSMITQFPANRTVLGVPFYTRQWWNQAGSDSSELVYMYQQNDLLSANNAESYWDTELHQNVASWTRDGVAYRMWMEDSRSIAEKVGLVRTYGLGGVACWRLGFEDDGIWQVLMDGLQRGE